MSYEVKQGNIFGRLGSGIGQGLSEQLPKEIERGRLAQGLQQFEQQAGNLTPLQQLARLSSIPGITPQMIQSFGELARQQAQGQALGKGNEPITKFPGSEKTQFNTPNEIKAPSITQEEPLAGIQEGYIPLSYDQRLAEAGKRFNENPALFQNNPQNAINAVNEAEAIKEKTAQAYQTKHENLSGIQDNVVKRLGKHAENLNVKIPPDVYSRIEDKAIQATKSKKEGGEGLTEQQAMKKYGKELDEISREYANLNSIGKFGMLTNGSENNLNQIKALQKTFKKNDDLRNLAESLIANNGLSPGKAYYLAYPVSDQKNLNNYINKLPDLNKKRSFEKGYPTLKTYDVENETLKIAPELFKLMGTEGSPLAISEELNARGYDPNIWLNYVGDYKDKLMKRQSDELDKPRDWMPTLNDLWTFGLSGLKRLLEVPVLPPLKEQQ